MPQMLNGDGDIWRHLTTGNVILATGQIPTQNIFSHTLAGAPLVPKEWLSQVIFALANRAAGLNGVAWLTALIVATTYALLTMGLQHLHTRAWVAFAAAVAASAVGAIHALTRPHIFTWLFFTIFLLLLEDMRRNGSRRALWLLPLLMIVWANLHGAFITGLVLIAFYIVGAMLEKNWRQAVKFTGLWVGVLLASWINPAGPVLVVYNWNILQQRFLVDLTVEFQSPNFHVISTWPFVALLLFALAILARSSKRLDWTPLVLLLGWTAFALYSARNIPLFGLAAMPILMPFTETFIEETMPTVSRILTRMDGLDRKAWGWMWAIVALVGLIGAEASGTKLDAWGMGNTFDPHVLPVAAVDVIRTSPPAGNMFNEFNWGGYLLFRLWPDKKVFIDGWTDFYGEALTREYLQAVNAEPGWESILDRYNVNWVIVAPTRPLAARLDESSGWLLQYKDDTAGVWVRR